MSNLASDELDHFGLLDTIIVIAEAWLLLLIAVVVGLAAGVGYYQLQPVIYRSQASLSLDGGQYVRFSSPDFLQKSGVDGAMWRFSLEHIIPPTEEQLRAEYAASFQAGSAEAAKAGLDGLISSFSAEYIPDSNRITAMEANRTRLVKSIADLDVISSTLASKVDTTLPGSESELYSRSVVLLLDAQSKREAELAALDAQLAAGAGGFVLSEPTLPQAPNERSPRPVVISSVAIAIFIALCIAFSREAVRRAARGPYGAEKLARLRNVFRLRSR